MVVPPFARPPVRWESEGEDDEAVAFLENYWSFRNLWDLLEERVVVVVHERMEHVLDQVLLDLLDQVLPDRVLYRRRFREVVPREEVALQHQHVLQQNGAVVPFLRLLETLLVLVAAWVVVHLLEEESSGVVVECRQPGELVALGVQETLYLDLLSILLVFVPRRVEEEVVGRWVVVVGSFFLFAAPSQTLPSYEIQLNLTF